MSDPTVDELSKWCSPALAAIRLREQLDRPTAELVAWEHLTVDHDGIDAIRLSLADVPMLKSGARKGRLNYKASTNRVDRIMLLDDEMRAWANDKQATGFCLRCVGSGEVFVRWSRDEGTTTKPCPECGGKRIAQADPATQPDLFGAAS